MDVAQIARVTLTSPDRVRDVLHNFNLDRFDSLSPRYRGGRPPTFTLAQRRAVKQLALSRPQGHDLAADGAPPTAARTGCGTCWPPTISHATGSMGHVKPRKRRGEFLAFVRANRNARDRRLGEILNRANIA